MFLPTVTAIVLWVASVSLALSTAALPPPGAAACALLSSTLQLPNTTIQALSYVTANATLTFPNTVSSCLSPGITPVVNVCRLQLLTKTSNDSQVKMEAWLPDEWFGRFLASGNGGLNGCIAYADLVLGTQQHFATIGTNNGHDGNTGVFFLGHPEVLIDFGSRAITTEVAIGKAIIEQYYGRPQEEVKSYFTGCSNGGKEAFKMAQDFPELFDGIVGGSPAIDWNSYMGAGAFIGRFLGLVNNGVGLLPPLALALVTKDVLDQCDGIDGVVDGVIDDPNMCDYIPENIMCPGGVSGTTSACLNATQVEAVRKLFAPIFGTHGEILFDGFQPGMTGSSPQDHLGPGVYPNSLDWFRYTIFNDSSYTAANFTTSDIELANDINPGGTRAFQPNVTAFIARGGKLISYHGTQDQHFSSQNTLRYRTLVSRTLGIPLFPKSNATASVNSTNPSSLNDFWRHFQIPGMQHCAGGPGAWQIGGSQTPIAGLKNSTEENVLLAVVDWVEQGKAPDRIVGTKFVNDTVALGVQRQRPYCPWPQKSVWNQKGDVTLATSFECVGLK